MTKLKKIFKTLILATTFICFISFNKTTVYAAEGSNDNLILYKTNNYNLSTSCTFTGLNGFYELQRCSDVPENIPNDEPGCLSWNHTYMNYKKVTSKCTNQYQVLNSEYAWTDEASGLRMYKDRICVAVGQGYGVVAGDYIDIVMEDNVVIKCIVGDMKAEVDTDPTMRYHNIDGSVVECIVDYDYFQATSQYPEFLGTTKKVMKIVPVNDLYEDSFKN